jgi:hypothetical protein
VRRVWLFSIGRGTPGLLPDFRSAVAGRRGPPGTRIGCDRVFAGGFGAKVGDHLVGWFCRSAPTPGTGRPNRNTGGPQIAADRLPPDVYGLFNAPQRPAQPPQRDDLLSLFLAQDIAHVDGGYSPRQESMSRISCSVGFQVITIGRVWVIPEAEDIWIAARQRRFSRRPPSPQWSALVRAHRILSEKPAAMCRAKAFLPRSAR